MKLFFLDSFKLNFHANQALFERLMEHEDVLPDKAIKLASHIINVHHIWLSVLSEKSAESLAWDVLPLSYLCALNNQNHNETIHFIEFVDCSEASSNNHLDSFIFPDNISRILQHVLTHSAYHRGQIVFTLKENNLSFPNMDWTSIR